MARPAGRSGYGFTVEDVGFLRSAAGEQACAAADELALTEATLLADLSRLRRGWGDRAVAAAETVRLRRRAVPKFGPGAARWLLTETALQQGTPRRVAEHRAARLAGTGVHDLTCSIGADLVVLAGGRATVVGSDRDPVRVAMAAHNLAESGWPARVFLADAVTVTTRGLLGYADPARRDGTGRRITSADTVPSVADLDGAHAARPPVLRLPPGIDYQALDRPGEVEIVSLDGVAREAVCWPAELAGAGRRASVLRSTGRGYQVTDAEPDEVPVAEAGEFLMDPDPAVIRAGLVRQFAGRHGLWQLDRHLAYLTGDAVPAGMRGFQVREAAPFKEKTVAGWLRRDGIGTLEILQRGTSVVPDELRRRLRGAMTRDTTREATLIIARVGRRPLAYWCRAWTAGDQGRRSAGVFGDPGSGLRRGPDPGKRRVSGHFPSSSA